MLGLVFGLVFGLKAGAHLIDSNRSCGIRLERIVGRADLFHEPFFNGTVTGYQHAQAIADDLALAYSPEVTLAFTASAISLGRVMLNCWVERIQVSEGGRRI